MNVAPWLLGSRVCLYWVYNAICTKPLFCVKGTLYKFNKRVIIGKWIEYTDSGCIDSLPHPVWMKGFACDRSFATLNFITVYKYPLKLNTWKIHKFKLLFSQKSSIELKEDENRELWMRLLFCTCACVCICFLEIPSFKVFKEIFRYDTCEKRVQILFSVGGVTQQLYLHYLVITCKESEILHEVWLI